MAHCRCWDCCSPLPCPVGIEYMRNGSRYQYYRGEAWYQKDLWIIVFLVMFLPVGLLLMWRYAAWRNEVKWALTILLVLVGLLHGLLQFWLM